MRWTNGLITSLDNLILAQVCVYSFVWHCVKEIDTRSLKNLRLVINKKVKGVKNLSNRVKTFVQTGVGWKILVKTSSYTKSTKSTLKINIVFWVWFC